MNPFAKRVHELTDPEVREFNKKDVQPSSEAQLQGIEKELGISLPHDYREFLRDYGGISLSSNQCRRAAVYHLHSYNWGRASINFFYTAKELLENAKSQREDSYIPKELITIGEDGNVLLFLAVSGRWKGSVYQWYPDYFPEKLHYYPELELISRSFTHFMGMLRVREDDAKIDFERREVEQVRSHLEALTLPERNLYSSQMTLLNARYVYCTLGGIAPTLTSTHFEVMEKEIGFRLPSDYREFLRNFSGYSFLPLRRHDGYYGNFPQIGYGEPHPGTAFRPLHYIKYFHGYMRDDLHSLLDHCQRLRGVLPKGIIPIADGGGICLSLAGEDKGTVYIAGEGATERVQETPPPIERNSLVPIASTFDEFITAIEIHGP